MPVVREWIGFNKEFKSGSLERERDRRLFRERGKGEERRRRKGEDREVESLIYFWFSCGCSNSSIFLLKLLSRFHRFFYLFLEKISPSFTSLICFGLRLVPPILTCPWRKWSSKIWFFKPLWVYSEFLNFFQMVRA